MTTTDSAQTSPGQATRGWYFHFGTAKGILGAAAAGQTSVRISLDLGISKEEWEIREGGLVLDGERGICLDLSALEPVQGVENKIFHFDGRTLTPVEIRADGYYKLVPTESLPTLEINGVKMHRSKDIDPGEDARAKTALVVRPGDIVLDTCGGLGYSAVFAVKAGAVRVMSTEKSRAVLAIRDKNPWLWPGAFPWLDQEAAQRIRLEHKDIFQGIKDLEDGCFDAIIHDPPRFTSATGDLYGRQFYTHLARVLRPCGRLFHYTGSPKRIKNGNRFVANAGKRLTKAGFAHVEFNDFLQGLVAEKAGDKDKKRVRKRP